MFLGYMVHQREIKDNSKKSQGHYRNEVTLDDQTNTELSWEDSRTEEVYIQMHGSMSPFLPGYQKGERATMRWGLSN